MADRLDSRQITMPKKKTALFKIYNSCLKQLVIYRLTHIIRCAAVFHTRVFARTNCWADFLEILHGWLLDDSKWDSRGTFFIFDLEPLI